MKWVIVLIGAVVIVWGIVSLVNPDIMWKLQDWSNRTRGLVSERTDTWGTINAIYGIVVIGVGIVLFLLALFSVP